MSTELIIRQAEDVDVFIREEDWGVFDERSDLISSGFGEG